MSALTKFHDAIPSAMNADQHSLRRLLRSMKNAERAGKPFDRNLAKFTRQLEASSQLRQRRAAGVPKITYPSDLPVVERRTEIADAIRDHQVIVVCGETGSGKSTQLPKIALELGRGVGGVIGHTQPRRIAARSIATRLAEELNCELGKQVGYRIRFNDSSGPNTLIRLMTDGIMLAETQSDRLLEQYDTIIVDEAHERSLNIDFLLGYLKRLLPKRPDLRIIITSATIDAERFAEHFGTPEAPAPVLLVEGRTYPVEIRYRPLDDDVRWDSDPADSSASHLRPLARRAGEGDVSASSRNIGVRADRDWLDGVSDAIDELAENGSGHILVFLPTERDIREADRKLSGRKYPGDTHQHPTQIVPLFGRLSMADQAKVFQSYQHRRIVLATNVAESSLTVPGIRYVVDTGTARISRYSARSRMQRLPIEAVSQASANQRAGRCGRIAPGICIRLYSEEDFLAREAFTSPEIQRTNLAAVILRTLHLQLGRLEDFPFLDPPRPTTVKEGYKTLEELGAIEEELRVEGRESRAIASRSFSPDGEKVAGGRMREPRSGGESSETRHAKHKTPPPDPLPFEARRDNHSSNDVVLTTIGRQMARLPVDPRISRMILAAIDEHAVPEVLVIAAALETQDPRERPIDKQQAADEAHAKFNHADSDFLTYVNLWDAWHEQKKKLSGGQLKKWCRQNFISWMRMREWIDVHRQLRDLLSESGDNALKKAASLHHTKDRKNDFAAIHRALMTGLLANLAYKSADGEYTGAGGNKLAIWPGSALFSKSPKWFVAGELVETTKRYARTIARVQPEWIEPLAMHLVTREYSEPHWDSDAGNVMAFEKVSLWGLPIVPRRKVTYAKVDPVKSRELLIQHGLVELGLLFGRTEDERRSDYDDEEKELLLGSRSRLVPGRSQSQISSPKLQISNFKSQISNTPWSKDFPFLRHNLRVLDEVKDLQARTRQHDLLPTDDMLFEIYAQQIPADIADRVRLRKWYQKTHRTNPGLLKFDINQFTHQEQRDDSHADFPPTIQIGAMTLPLTYQLGHGTSADGVTVTVPADALPQLDDNRLSWLVPGLVEEKVVALIRSLPKTLRTKFVPAPDTAKKVCGYLKFGTGNLLTTVADLLSRIAGERIDPNSFDLSSLPDHLRFNINVISTDRKPLAEGRSVDAVRQQLAQKVHTVTTQTGPSPEEVRWHRKEFKSWEFGDVPASIDIERAGMVIKSFPALRDDDTSVSLTLCQTAAESQATMKRGLRRLILLSDEKRIRQQVENLPKLNDLRIKASSIRGLNVVAQLQQLMAERAYLSAKELPRNKAAFEQTLDNGRKLLGTVAQEFIQLIPQIFEHYHVTRRQLDAAKNPGWKVPVDALQQQFSELMRSDFLATTPWPWLIQYPRYLAGIRQRLQRLASGGLKTELELQSQFIPYQQRYEERREQHKRQNRRDPMLDHYRWMLEEYRIGLFAPKLGTAITVSGEKLDEHWLKVT
ncbi:MAG: DUF3418 domain-containing protein [Planctomycetaceae bacterium]